MDPFQQTVRSILSRCLFVLCSYLLRTLFVYERTRYGRITNKLLTDSEEEYWKNIGNWGNSQFWEKGGQQISFTPEL